MTVMKPQMTLIDTFSEGYAAINRRLWLIMVPIALNLYLWFGAHLSFYPLVEQLHALMRPSIEAADQAELQTQLNEQMTLLGQLDMRQQLSILNFIPTLTINVVSASSDDSSGFPVVQTVPQTNDKVRGDTIVVSSLLGALGAFLVLNALALGISAAFMTQLAAAVRNDKAPAATWARRVWRATVAILGYVGIFGGVLLALGLPFLFLTALLIYFSQALGLLAMSCLLIAWFWIRIYIGFAPEAIAISGIGSRQALHASFNIVRRNFWGTLGFLAISYIIMAGSGVIWMVFAHSSTIGVIVASVGSAYLGSGLLAARMAFYRERLRRWQSAVAGGRLSL